MKNTKFILIIGLMLMFLSVGLLAASTVSAADPQDIYVNKTGDDSNGGTISNPYGSIGKAINVSDASKDATIHLGEGTFLGENNTNIVIDKDHTGLGGSLTIKGQGNDKTYINGEGISQIFNISANSIVTLINLSIINGKTTSGGAGAIANYGTLNIQNCIFDNNTAGTATTAHGGAIRSFGGNISIESSLFTNNVATGDGGAIYVDGSDLYINNSNFTSNQGRNGGVIYSYWDGDLTVSNSIFKENNATTSGGAIYVSYYMKTTIDNSTFIGNNASTSGGALYLQGAANFGEGYFQYMLLNSEFYNNTANTYGGDIWATYTDIINNTIVNGTTRATTTSSGGGAIYGNNLYLKNNTMNSCLAASGNGNYIFVNGVINSTKITFNDIVITNPTFTLTANVTDDNGNPIHGNYIEFYANSTSLGAGNVINGMATLTTTILLDNGIWIITGSPSTYYYPNSNYSNGTLNVNIDFSPVIYYVSPGGDDNNNGLTDTTPFKTIKKAIDTGFTNNVYVTIYLLDGVYTGEGNVNLTINKLGTLNIIGLNHNQVIFDGDAIYGLLFGFSSDMQVNLANLTIINFNNTVAYSEGVIYSNGTYYKYGLISISNCIFENNNGNSFALLVNFFSGSVVNSSFINNNIGCLQIATYTNAGFASIKYCNFTNNINNGYGLITIHTSSVFLENCIFFNNSITSYNNLVSLGINASSSNNQFINNTHTYSTGAIFSFNYDGLSFNDTFDGNKANRIITIEGYYVATFLNNTFINNTVGTNGSIFYIGSNDRQANITNCTFIDNINVGTIVNIANGGLLNNAVLRVESVNSTSLVNNILKVYFEFTEFTVKGGSVNFYINGVLVGSASFVNGVAEFSISGYGDGIYEVTVISSSFPNTVIQNGILNISANQKHSLVIYVGENGNDGTGNGSESNPFATIQKAINVGTLSTLNLTIFVLPGTLKGVGNVNITLPNYLNITITGIKDSSIIDGNATSAIFTTTSTSANTIVKFSNLTITNAKGNILNIGGSALIDNCIFSNNNGSSVYFTGSGKLVINNSVFKDNFGATSGTGVSAASATSTLEIYNTIFSNNTATSYGSAIYINALNNTIISGCTFKDSKTTTPPTFGTGGAISFRGSINGKILSISDCNFTNNDLDLHHTWSTGATAAVPIINLINCTFNSTGGITGGSGAQAYYEALWTVINCSFINMQCDNILYTSNPAGNGLNTVDYYYLSFFSRTGSIIQGCLFENVTGLTFGGNITIIDCAIINTSLTLMKGYVTSLATIYLNNNYWGSENPYDCFIKIELYGYNQYLVTTILDYWIVPKLVTDGVPGLSQEITMIFVLTDDEGNFYNYNYSNCPIPIEEVSLIASAGTLSENNGNVSVTHEFTSIFSHNQFGNYTITATFANGLSSLLNIALYQYETETSVVLSNNSGKKGDTVNITVEVTDKNTGILVNEGSVELFLKGSSLGVFALINGKYTTSLVMNGTAGIYEVYANYLGSENFSGSFNFELYNLQNVTVTISGIISSSSPTVGDNVTITANLVSSDGSVVNEGIVDFYFANTLIGSANVINGKASISWIVDAVVGSSPLSFKYGGTDSYATDNGASSPITITVANKTSTSKSSVEIIFNSVAGIYGQSVPLTATLKDSQGNAVVGKTIDFYVNNIKVGTAVTNGNGVATFNYIVSYTGILSLNAIFDGDGSYLANSKVATLTVPDVVADTNPLSKAATVKVKNTKVVKKNKITLKTILANLGPDRFSFKITYKLPKGIIYKKPKVSTGKISYNKKTRTLTWTVTNLKLHKTKSATLQWTVTAKKGKYTISPKVKKVAGLKISQNKALKNIKVK